MNDYRILVVDDEEDLCEILKFNLENEGYEVDTANSAEEALRMDIGSYSLLLLDVMMGEISGFKMASMLKKDKKTAQIPIIFITAKDTENDTVTGFNLGADDYIVKPFDPMELVARVKSHLLRYERLTGKPYLDAPDKEKRNMHRNRLSTRRWYWTSSRRKSALTAKRHRSPKKNLKSYCCFCRIKDAYSRARIY